MHDKRVHCFGSLLHFVLHLSLPRGRRALRRPRSDSAGVLHHPLDPHRARSGNRPARVNHARARAARPLRAASADRAMDVADLDVRVGDRRGGLSDGVQAVSASPARGDGGRARARARPPSPRSAENAGAGSAGGAYALGRLCPSARPTSRPGREGIKDDGGGRAESPLRRLCSNSESHTRNPGAGR